MSASHDEDPCSPFPREAEESFLAYVHAGLDAERQLVNAWTWLPEEIWSATRSRARKWIEAGSGCSEVLKRVIDEIDYERGKDPDRVAKAATPASKSRPAIIEAIPHQLPIHVELFEAGLSIDQTGAPEGTQSIWVAATNIDLLIEALTQAQSSIAKILNPGDA